MRFGIRIVACIAMMAIALTMVVFTVADFREAQEGSFILREHQGKVAVFQGGGDKEPLAITDIELGSLRLSDREKLAVGIRASNEGTLQELLEDLGS